MITPAWFKLKPHPLQSRMWRTKARFVSAACGRGSGKTLLARRRVVRFLHVRKPWADPIYFYALPTRDQAKRVAWDKINALIPDSWIAKNGRSISELTIKTVFGSKLYIVGMDKPERIEGDQWDGGVLDESCDQRPTAFARSVRPALSHKEGWCWRIGVPKRFGPGAQDFKDFWEASNRGELGPNYEAYTWPSSDIMSEEEIADAQTALDQRDFDEQYGAVWQSTSGLIFYAFDPVLNVRNKEYDPGRTLIIGSDFNVDPMAWVVLQQYDREYYVIDELFLRNTNTQRTLDELHRKYSNHQSGWVFIGDASARARKTSASFTDYLIIAGDQRFANKKVLYPHSNPAIADRFAACNREFCTAAGDRYWFVHSRCKNLIKDLTARAYQEGTRSPDDYGDVGHITDALGYVIHYIRPIIVDFGEMKVFSNHG